LDESEKKKIRDLEAELLKGQILREGIRSVLVQLEGQLRQLLKTFDGETAEKAAEEGS
jgi:hypothetical protein